MHFGSTLQIFQNIQWNCLQFYAERYPGSLPLFAANKRLRLCDDSIAKCLAACLEACLAA